MEFSLLNMMPGNLAEALCATLLHSLWEGLALSLLAGAVMVSTKNTSAAKRYNMLIGLMLVFTVAVAVTFAVLYQGKPVSVQSIAATDGNAPVNNIVNQAVVTRQTSFIANAGTYLNNHAAGIVLVWLLIVSARCLQLLTGLHGLYHLKRKSVFAVDESWERYVSAMAARMGIPGIVHIAGSGLAKVPMVIGHLKPLILLPVGLLTALPPAEVEAILVHELAHIRRRDYLVNLLQSLLEIVFFFNPAVLWLSALIRTERENCCDDIAVSQTSSKVNYIRALVSCQQYRQSAPAFAMAIKDKEGHLLSRVKRMVSGNNQSLSLRERSLLGVVLLAAMLFTAAFTNAAGINGMVVKATQLIKKEMPVKKQNAKLTMETHDTLSRRASLLQPVINDDTIKKAREKEAADTLKKLVTQDSITQINRLGKLKGSLGSMTGNNEKSLSEMKRLAKMDSINLAERFKQLQAVKNNDPAYKARTAEYKASTTGYQQSAYKDYNKPYEPSKEPTIGDKVTEELIKDGLAAENSPSLSFKLSEKEMIINGKKQPDEIFQKYKAKFVPPLTGKNGWTLYHNYDTDTQTKP
ncbi:M56 family metallopeptidase [Mucilaginibacter celer]|uniref:M56 family metallopeptidase n=1 Tax=Mucilaginibacter celer TaxID=2305508 RepID=A0A494VPC3_9SPHI|nr:M56 family metallopeptidase [Mucilaginibacter celer]AYL95681.1 M56 family metallopeptidase [Mucilaginibacter celer]